MSAGRKKKDPLDRYDTDAATVRNFLRHWRLPNPTAAFIWEPAAGANHIGMELAKRYPLAQLFESDIEPRGEKVTTLDFFEPTPGELSPADLIITNPPFRLAEQFLPQAMRLTREGGYVVFLLRAAFLESEKRHNLLDEFPPIRGYFLRKRPEFTGPNVEPEDSGDSAMYAWFVWQKGKRPKSFRGYII